LASDVQALGPDIIEATKYAQAMSAEEVDDVIDHILDQVKFFIPHVDTTTHPPFQQHDKDPVSILVEPRT
jgi:hypothetical protein